MNTNLPALPLGRSTFSALRKSGAFFVDKTQLIFKLCSRPAKVFLARPRRFGKSLLASTFLSLFKYGLRDFEGLEIESRWTDATYRVVLLDLSLVKDFSSVEDFRRQFIGQVAQSFHAAGYDGEAELSSLQAWLLAQPARSLVLLIDEYDAPLTACLDRPECLSAVQALLSEFFAGLKACERCFRFLFVTRITNLSNTGIFSDFGGLEDISTAPDFGALLGFTGREIRESFAPYVTQAAELLNLSEDEVLCGLQKNYGGYCFDARAQIKVLCPWSVLNFFNRPARGFLNYWFQSGGGGTALVEHLGHHELAKPAAFAKAIKVPLERLRPSGLDEALTPDALLFQTGYLTIRSVSAARTALLSYPNEEIVQSFARLYAYRLLKGRACDALDAPGAQPLALLLAVGTLDAIVQRFNDLLEAIDHQHYPVTDAAACSVYLQVLMTGIEMVPGVKAHALKGAHGLEVRAGHRHWVFEIKFVRKECEVEAALAEGLQEARGRELAATHAGKACVHTRAVLVFCAQTRAFAAWAQA